jgi:hypothetical protein
MADVSGDDETKGGPEARENERGAETAPGTRTLAAGSVSGKQPEYDTPKIKRCMIVLPPCDIRKKISQTGHTTTELRDRLYATQESDM